jgi:hypothetical protein
MTTKTIPDHRWEISRIAAKTKFLGYVHAPGEKTALARAIEEFQVPTSLQQRLIARKGN